MLHPQLYDYTRYRQDRLRPNPIYPTPPLPTHGPPDRFPPTRAQQKQKNQTAEQFHRWSTTEPLFSRDRRSNHACLLHPFHSSIPPFFRIRPVWLWFFGFLSLPSRLAALRLVPPPDLLALHVLRQRVEPLQGVQMGQTSRHAGGAGAGRSGAGARENRLLCVGGRDGGGGRGDRFFQPYDHCYATARPPY